MLRFEYKKGKGIIIYREKEENFKELYILSVKSGIVTLVKLLLLLFIVILVMRMLKGV